MRPAIITIEAYILQAKLSNDTEIARAKRDYELKKAGYDVEVNTAEAEAQLAYNLQVIISSSNFNFRPHVSNVFATFRQPSYSNRSRSKILRFRWWRGSSKLKLLSKKSRGKSASWSPR